jgi:hypothetical protein
MAINILHNKHAIDNDRNSMITDKISKAVKKLFEINIG